jgi:hypothetical protein
MQYAMRHADPRTTMRYDMAKANLDRHAAHAVAAYLAGMSTGQSTHRVGVRRTEPALVSCWDQSLWASSRRKQTLILEVP